MFSQTQRTEARNDKNENNLDRQRVNTLPTRICLDDEFAQAHAALGLASTVNRQYDEAVLCAKRATELQPGGADVHLFSTFCHLFAGDTDAAYGAIGKALRLDPQYINGPYLNVLAFVCLCAERYEEALDALQRNVDRGGPLAPPALAFRTACFSASGRMTQAKEAAHTLLGFLPGFSLSRYRLLHMFRSPEISERIITALRNAGLPE